jgi:hypothetical protein
MMMRPKDNLVTKIYIYCLFDRYDNFLGVYSSLKAVHRDAIKACNRGHSKVWIVKDGSTSPCTLVSLRNVFKGKCNYEVRYQSDVQCIKIFKTKLKE